MNTTHEYGKNNINLTAAYARLNYSYRTSPSKRATTSTLNHTRYDPSLVWYNLTSTVPQIAAEFNMTECITEMELIAGYIYSTESEQHDTFVEKTNASYDSLIMNFSQSDQSHEMTAYEIL
jgi:hypothetical protein